MAQTEIDYRVPVFNPGTRMGEYPESDVSGDSADPRELAKYARYVSDLWHEQDAALRPLHQIWMENLLFLANRQWYVRKGDRLVLEEVPSWRKQPVVNLCLPYYRTFLAKVTKNRPAQEVIAASSDPDDLHAAELALEILKAKHEELKIPGVIRRAVSWTIVTGNGYIYPYWNTSTGKMKRMEVLMDVPVYDDDGVEIGTEELLVPLDDEGDPILGEDSRPKPGAEPTVVDMGDIAGKVYSPFHVRVDPDAEDDTEVTWFTVAEVVSLREIQRRWKDAFSGDGPRPSAEDVAQMEEYSSAISAFTGGSKNSTSSPLDQRDRELEKAIVFAYHQMPSPEYPNGRYWTCTKDVVLDKPQDLPEGLWPGLIHLTDVVVPGRYHAASTFESIVRLNREYNEINADIQEHHGQFIQGKWLNPRGSGVTKGSITRQPGEVITHNLGFEPKQAELKPLPSAVYQERERVLNDYELVGGIHRVSMGKPPPGVESGVAFLQLQEADDTDLGPFLAMLEESVAQLAAAFLRIIKARYTEERLVMVTGPNRKYQVRAFRGADLAGAVDVRAVAESAYPRSRVAQQSMLLSMLQQVPEYFVDQETGRLDKTRFAQMLPIGGLESFANSEDVDIAHALSEHELFASYGTGESNQLPEVAWFEDSEVHYNIHRRAAVSGEYKKWPKPAQDEFLVHLEKTKRKRDQERAQKNIANGGTPPGQQAPPGPGADPGQMMQMASEGDVPVSGVPAAPAEMEQAEMVAELEAARAQTEVI